MFRQQVYATSFALVLSLIVTNAAEAVNPVGWWRLDDGAGLTAVDSVGEHDGALTGPLTWVEGRYGGALQFEGGNGSPFVDLGAWQTDGPDGLSLCFWAKWDGTNGFYQGFLSQREGTMYWWTELNPDGTQLRFKSNTDPQSNLYLTEDLLIEGEWAHLAFSHDAVENTGTIYFNGEERLSGDWDLPAGDFSNLRIGIGVVNTGDGLGTFNGALDDVMIFQMPLSQDEVLAAMQGDTGGYSLARSPEPSDGAIIEATWVNLSWQAGDSAVSHDVYLGDNYDDVLNGTEDTFRGNQTSAYYLAGFPGYAYPEGLEPGMTYYWRVDEVNDADPDSPWKGPIWSFSIAPRTAYNPDPPDGSAVADSNDVTLSWTAGYGAKLHAVYFGDNYDEVNNATGGTLVGATVHNPGVLETEKVYYWRIDEFDGSDTYKGDVWCFTTPGAVGDPQPAYNATNVGMDATLSWTPADSAASHQLYFGTDKEAVRNAGTGAAEYKGSKALGAESYNPGLLEAHTTYYWRVDEVDDQGNVSTGPLWVFTTGAYLLVDDFESYTDDDAAGQAIWQTWIDGFGVADNGAQVGYLMPPYAERSIVHGGAQSMPLLYVNEAGVTNSEASMTLTAPRDWTQAGVAELSLWFRGASGNAAEPLYVSIANSAGAPAVVANDDLSAATVRSWTQWTIPLQAFADQGIDLSNVNTIAIGVGTKGNVAALGGSGTMYLDDIRLYRR